MKNNFIETGIGIGMLPGTAQLLCLDKHKETEDH